MYGNARVSINDISVLVRESVSTQQFKPGSEPGLKPNPHCIHTANMLI